MILLNVSGFELPPDLHLYVYVPCPLFSEAACLCQYFTHQPLYFMVRVNSKPGIPCWCCPSGGSAHHSAKATKQNWMINSLLDLKHPPQPGLKCLIVHFTSDQYPGIRAYVFTETMLLFGAALYCQLRLTAEAWHSDTEKRQWVRRWAALISKGDY